MLRRRAEIIPIEPVRVMPGREMRVLHYYALGGYQIQFMIQLQSYLYDHFLAAADQ